MVKMVCANCGSEDVLADAYASWNYTEQRWEVESTFDKGAFCRDCDGDTRIDEKEVS